MRHTSVFTCDICERAKGAVNHWWVAYTDAGRLVLSTWNEELAAADDAKHLCGNGCTQKMVERWLAIGSVEAARAAAGDTA
ncbi:MAG TPA: hypothetical protein VFL42_11930 [Terriglobales bacterium]|nr:hypothetical protein [Terriglobales bacterium]